MIPKRMATARHGVGRMLLLVLLFAGGGMQEMMVVKAQTPKSQVTMSLDEFQDIFSSARLAEAERRLQDQQKQQKAEHQRKQSELQEMATTTRNDIAANLQQRKHLFPQNFQVLSHTVQGMFNASSPSAGVEQDVANFDVTLIVRVLESQWTVIPLVNATSTVASDWTLEWRGDSNSEIQERREFQSVDPVAHPDVMLLLRDGQQLLATNRSGLFRASFRAYTRVSKSHQSHLRSVGLSSLLYPLSNFSLRISVDDHYAGFIKDLSVQPVEAILQLDSKEGYADIKATLPLNADRVQIRWLHLAKEEIVTSKDGIIDPGEHNQTANAVVVPQIIAKHEALHSVDEGILRSTHDLLFSTTSDVSSINSIRFSFHGKGVRVASLVGHAVESWSVEKAVGSGTPTTLVHVLLKSSHLDSTTMLKVHTEMDRDPSLAHLELPSIECHNVLRQTGEVAIIKEANVEVHEHKIAGLARCDPSDLSSRLRLNTNRPIVLGYKYLNAQNSILLNVKEHTSIDTLEASIDRIHYKAVVTETHTVHSMLLIVQSTKLQYLELLALPATASQYTVAVNSVSAKPVEGSNGSILVPLLVGLNPASANGGGSRKTSVEITYFSQHDPLGSNGTLALSPPGVALPVSVQTVHLRLPEAFTYEFSGDFGKRPLPALAYPIPAAFAFATGRRVVEDGYEFSPVDEHWPEEEEQSEQMKVVKIVTPRMGRSFHFDKLLVIDGGLLLNASYTDQKETPSRSWWKSLL